MSEFAYYDEFCGEPSKDPARIFIEYYYEYLHGIDRIKSGWKGIMMSLFYEFKDPNQLISVKQFIREMEKNEQSILHQEDASIDDIMDKYHQWLLVQSHPSII